MSIAAQSRLNDLNILAEVAAEQLKLETFQSSRQHFEYSSIPLSKKDMLRKTQEFAENEDNKLKLESSKSILKDITNIHPRNALTKHTQQGRYIPPKRKTSESRRCMRYTLGQLHQDIVAELCPAKPRKNCKGKGYETERNCSGNRRRASLDCMQTLFSGKGSRQAVKPHDKLRNTYQKRQFLSGISKDKRRERNIFMQCVNLFDSGIETKSKVKLKRRLAHHNKPNSGKLPYSAYCSSSKSNNFEEDSFEAVEYRELHSPKKNPKFSIFTEHIFGFLTHDN